MKKLVINNVAIQFKCSNKDNNMEAASELIDSINDILRKELPDIDIRVLVSDMFSPIDIDLVWLKKE
jgi:hypothetical protein